MSVSSRTSPRLQGAIPYVGVLLAAATFGAVVARIQWQVSVAIAVVALATLGLAALRMVVARSRRVVESVVEASETAALRPARLVYYGGVATVGFLTVRPAAGFTASDWIFLAALGLACVIMIVQGIQPHYLVPGAITAGVVIFALGGFLSSTQALYPYASAFIVVRMLYLTLVWFWLGSILLETRKHVQTAVLLWVCSAALSSAGAVAQYLYGDVVPGGTIAWGRMTGFTEHFNVLGGLASTAFVPALMLAVDGWRPRVRLIGTVGTALIAAGLLLSGSVGGLLAASVGMLVWLALRGVSVRLVIGAAVIVACGLGLMSASGSTDAPSPIERIERASSSERAAEGTGGTIFTRIEGFSLAWDRIAEQPFVGVGLDPETSAEELDGHSVHNLVLGPWFTAGILGLIGIVTLVCGAVVTAFRVLLTSPPPDRAFDAALAAALVAFIQHGMGEPILFVRYGWLPTALLVALRVQAIRAGAPAVTTRRRPVTRVYGYGAATGTGHGAT